METAKDLVQIYPNRITVSSRIVRDWQRSWERKNSPPQSIANLKKKKSSVSLSQASKKEIRDSIFSMYQLSPPRTVKAVNGKFIYNFRQSFVTLTLPSEQIHTDVEIKKCLNHFLTNLRRAFKIENYVWKAELQKNENIHFHLSFDKYVHYQAIRYYWLLAIKPLGYVQRYREKFENMTLFEYAQHRKRPPHEVSSAFEQGRRSRWESPNCVDVSSVTTASSVSNYLSKYFAKNEETDLDPQRIETFGKVWSRSSSLSRLKYKHKFEWQEIKEFIRSLVETKALKRVAYDFSTVYYFNFRKLAGSAKNWLESIIKWNAERYDYPIPI